MCEYVAVVDGQKAVELGVGVFSWAFIGMECETDECVDHEFFFISYQWVYFLSDSKTGKKKETIMDSILL